MAVMRSERVWQLYYGEMSHQYGEDDSIGGDEESRVGTTVMLGPISSAERICGSGSSVFDGKLRN